MVTGSGSTPLPSSMVFSLSHKTRNEMNIKIKHKLLPVFYYAIEESGEADWLHMMGIAQRVCALGFQSERNKLEVTADDYGVLYRVYTDTDSNSRDVIMDISLTSGVNSDAIIYTPRSDDAAPSMTAIADKIIDRIDVALSALKDMRLVFDI